MSKLLTMDYNNILKHWFSFCDFDPDGDNECYNGTLAGYDNFKLCKTIVKLIKEYNSPLLAFIMLRSDAEYYFNQNSWSIKDFAEGKCKTLVKLYKEIYSKENDEIENHFLEIVSKLTAKPDLIGAVDRNSIVKRVPSVIETTEKLKTHLFLSSGKPLSDVNIHDKIRVFSDMGLLLMEIEKENDGLFLCYINAADSIDGYFSFIYKSNGNIVSIDDHLNEAYIGQHRVERQRNARYTEDKGFCVFPYSYMFDLSGSDGKGNYTEYKLKGDFSLSCLPVERLFSLCLAMLLIMKKYKGKVFDVKNTVYSSYYIGNASKKLLEEKSLMIKNDSTIVKHSQLKIKLTEEDIFGYTKQHFDLEKGETLFHYSNHPQAVNRLLSIWCNDKVKKELPMQEDYSYLINDRNYIESLWNKDKMFKNAKYLMRDKAREVIQNNIDLYFCNHDFGNEAVKKYRKLLETKKDVVMSKIVGTMFVEVNKFINIGHLDYSKVNYRNDVYFPFNDITNYRITSKARYWKDMSLCDDNGLCRYVWTFRPESWIELCLFLEIDESELPVEMIGWTERANSVYGNDILSMCDQMEYLNTGFHSLYDALRYGRDENIIRKLFEEKTGKITQLLYQYIIYNSDNPFSFSIGMSRKTFKKLYPGIETRKEKEW